MTRIIGPPKSPRRRRTFLACFAAALSVGVVFIVVAQGAGNPQDSGLFQLDGNTLPGTCASPFPATTAGGGDDWAALFNNQATNPPCGSDGLTFVADGVGDADGTYWNGGGSKDAYDPQLGPWLWSPTDVAPDKDDINNAFAAIYHTDSAKFLYFGSDRFTTNGDAQQGFQFLQMNTCLQGGGSPPISAGGTAACPGATPNPPNVTCTPAFTGSNVGYFVNPSTGCPIHHLNGDLLVLVNFNNGGTLGQAGVFEWQGADGAGGGAYSQVLFGDGANCATVLTPNNFCSIANTGSLTSEPVWPYTKKGDNGAQSTYDPSAFIEGGINLSHIPGAGECFPSFLAETRSSAGPGSGLSLQAQLKDLAFGKFEQCRVAIKITPSATNEVGQPHTFTVHVDKLVGGTPTPLTTGNVDVTLTDSNGAASVLDTAASTCDDNQPDGTNLDSNGECKIVFTSNSAGQVTGHAKITASFGGGTFTAETDGVSPNGGDAVKTFVDANIAITPPSDTNEVGEPHTFTVTVQQNDGTGPPNPIAATNGHVDVTLANSNGATAVIDGPASTCDNAGQNLSAAGTCILVFTSATAGKVTGDASVTLTVGGLTLTRDTDSATALIGHGVGGSDADAVKTFVDANIAITPPSDTNEVGEPHTFTVTVQQNDGTGPPNPIAATNGHVDVTLANSNGATAVIDGPASTCDNAGQNLSAAGTCILVFTSATAGKVTGDASVTLTVGGLTLTRDTDSATALIGHGVGGSDADAVKTFVDANIAITPPSDTNEVGEPHTFTVTVQQNDGTGPPNPIAATNGHVDVTLANSNGATAVIDGPASTCDNAGQNLSAAGTCILVFTSATAGKVTGDASVTLTVGGLTLTRDTDSATALIGHGVGGSDADAVKTFVDANIAITPPSDTNEVGEPHTFTVTVQQNDGTGPPNPIAATNGHVDVTLANSNGATAVIDGPASTCDNAGQNLSAAGTCILVFTSATAGKVTGDASVTLTVGGLTLTRDTDSATALIGHGVGGSDADAVKTFVDANIAITPPSDTNEVGEPHTFTVTVQQNDGTGPPNPIAATNGHVDVTLANSNGATAVIDGPASTCDNAGQNLSAAGTCILVFTSATAGKVTGDASVTLTVGGLTLTRDTDSATALIGHGVGGSDADAVKTFVDANIAITPPSDTNEVGEPHTFTVTVQQNDGTGPPNPIAATNGHVDVTLANSNGATAVIDGPASTCDNAGQNLSAAGTCILVFTSATAGKVTGDASVTLTVGGLTLTRDTDSATALIGHGVGGSDADAVKTFVDAFITIGPDATNNVGEPHTFTVTVKQNLGDGNGFVAADNGHVDVTLTTISGSALAVVDTNASTCDNVDDNLDGSGQCTITFTSSTPGTIEGHAKVTIPKTVFGALANDVVRETDATGQNSGNATKIFLAGSISWKKVDNTGVTLQGGATFQLCQTAVFLPGSGTFLPIVPAACKDVVDNGAASATAYADDDPVLGQFKVGGLALGQYTVQETVAPDGFILDPDIVPVELNPTTPNFTITEAFVNTRPILKITGFGYTNSPNGTPTHGVTNGTVVYTVNLHNYGNAVALLTGSSLVVTAPPSANLVCGPTTPAITGTIIAGADGGPYTKTCTYDGSDGDVITATLTVQTDTNNVTRDASGSPATISFTVQAD